MQVVHSYTRRAANKAGIILIHFTRPIDHGLPRGEATMLTGVHMPPPKNEK